MPMLPTTARSLTPTRSWAAFSQCLKRHGLYQNTVIAIAADHGEAFGEHGEERHGMFLYDETIHVPLSVEVAGWASPPASASRRAWLWRTLRLRCFGAAGISPPSCDAGAIDSCH